MNSICWLRDYETNTVEGIRKESLHIIFVICLIWHIFNCFFADKIFRALPMIYVISKNRTNIKQINIKYVLLLTNVHFKFSVKTSLNKY